MADMNPENAADNEALARIGQEKAMELQQLVAEQVTKADPSAPITMTELLADEQGAFGQKVQELGMTAEWETFKAQQQEIGAMREEFMALEEQRSAQANKVADISPSLEQEASKVRKTSSIMGVVGAALGGIGAAYMAAKKTESNPIRAAIGAAGAVFGGAISAIFSAKRGVKKTMDKVQEQMGDLGNVEANPELEQKAAELQEKLGLAQQQSMEPLVDAVVERMAQQGLEAEKAAVQQTAEQMQQSEPQAAPQQPEAPAAEVASPVAHEPEAPVANPTPQEVAQQAAAAAHAPEQHATAEATQHQAALEDQLGAILAEHQQQPAPGGKAEAVLREREQQQASGPQR
jgi:hypothetical protein